jgi:GNAT superfamily N-acetyltransferase
MVDPIIGLVSVSVLGKQHNRSQFDCGVPSLDQYLKTQAVQDARRNLAAPFVLSRLDGSIVGYYTLSATALRLAEFPDDIVRKLPHYPLIPATLLGRLAVDGRYRGQGYGRFLLVDALYRSYKSEVASFAMIVEAKDDQAKSFYERESFIPFPDQPKKLFRMMKDIAQLFATPAPHLA